MKPRHLVLGLALAVAAGLVLFGDRGPADGVAEPVARPAPPPAAGHRMAARAAAPVEVAILPLRARAELVGGADEARAGDAFATHDWTPPPPPPPPAPPPPAASAPTLPFTYIGKSLEQGSWAVFLARGERTYVVHDKDTVEDSYRVESIKPPLMTLTYLPLNQAQQLNIGVFD